MGGHENAALIRRNFNLFVEGRVEDVYATWAPDAVWHVLDATPYQGDYSRDEYFSLLATLSEAVPDYEYDVVACQAFGDEHVVVYLRSSGTTPEGPIDPGGGLMIYRVVEEQVVEGWAMSRGREATTPF